MVRLIHPGIALVAALALTSVAPRTARAQASSEDADALARELYLDGEQHYAAGRYERAADLFQRAYELSGRPELLFNLGNCHERMGAYDEAAEYLRRYLDSPEARNRDAVEQRIERLEEQQARRQRELERLAGTGGEAAAADPLAASARDPAGRDLEPYWWLGGGGAALAGAIVLGVASRSAGSGVAAQCPEEDGVRLCPASAEGALSTERTLAVTADIVAVLGLAAAGYGGYMLWKRERGESPAERGGMALAPALVPDGIGIGVSGAF